MDKDEVRRKTQASIAEGLRRLETDQDPLFQSLQAVIYRSNRFVAPPSHAIPGDPPTVRSYDWNAPVSSSEESSPPNEIKIAVVSFEADLTNEYAFDRRSIPGETYRTRDGRRVPPQLFLPNDEGTRSLRSQVNVAVDAINASGHDPALLLIQELGLPTARSRSDQERYLSEVLGGVLEPAFVLAGTHHCPETHQNVALFAQPTRDHERRTWRHPKLTSAIEAEENIRVPSARNLQIYDTPIGRIGIMICLDVYDASQILAAARLNLVDPANRIEILLVPAFGMKVLREFHLACRSVSAILMNAVVGAHGRLPQPDQNESRHANQFLFGCGEQQEPIWTDRAGNASIFGVSLARLSERANEMRAQASNQFVTLFQNPRARMRALPMGPSTSRDP